MGEPEATKCGRVVRCPRCHEECGWCGDYRHMHGMLAMPGDPKRRRCIIASMAPEGDDCPVCRGTRIVTATTTYQPTGGLL